MWSRRVYEHVSRWKKTLPTGSYPDLFLDYILAWNHLHYPPNVIRPKTLNELYLRNKYNFKGDMDLARRVTDKFEIKKWLSETPKWRPLIVPNLDVFDSTDQIEKTIFQRETILKPTHMSGATIFFEKDRRLSSEEIREIDIWLNTDYYKRRSEPNYKGLKRRLIIEPILRDELGQLAKSFQFFMINGQNLMIAMTLDPTEPQNQQFYSPDWKLLSISNLTCLRHPEPYPQPTQLDAALDVAIDLSRPFPLCRVDLYLLPKGAIKAGEITFFPYAGSQSFAPPGTDLKLGRRARALMSS